MRVIRLTSLCLASLVAGTLSISAQNTRPTPKPLATPPTVSGAEIISRAGELHEAPLIMRADPQSAEPLTTDQSAEIKELRERIKMLEAGKKEDPDAAQKRMMMNLDILTRAEQRTESLRKQHFELIEKENTLKSRLDQIQVEMRPEMINRALQLGGSLRPEEIREGRRKSLEAESANLQQLLNDIQQTRATLQANLTRSEQMAEKLRVKLEKEIDDSFLKDNLEI